MHVFEAWHQWRGLCQGVPCVQMECSYQSYCHGVVKTVATILRFSLASLLTAVFSLVADRPIRFNHMVGIVYHMDLDL